MAVVSACRIADDLGFGCFGCLDICSGGGTASNNAQIGSGSRLDYALPEVGHTGS